MVEVCYKTINRWRVLNSSGGQNSKKQPTLFDLFHGKKALCSNSDLNKIYEDISKEEIQMVLTQLAN